MPLSRRLGGKFGAKNWQPSFCLSSAILLLRLLLFRSSTLLPFCYCISTARVSGFREYDDISNCPFNTSFLLFITTWKRFTKLDDIEYRLSFSQYMHPISNNVYTHPMNFWYPIGLGCGRKTYEKYHINLLSNLLHLLLRCFYFELKASYFDPHCFVLNPRSTVHDIDLL